MPAPEKKRAPAYPWYPRDFDMDEEVKLMTYEEEGIYRRLLDHQWFHDGLPSDVDKIARLVPKIPPARFKRMWPAMAAKFALVDDRLVNLKLERVRQEKDEFHTQKRTAGLLSAAARRERHGSAQPKAAPNTTPNGVRTGVRTEVATDAEPASASASAHDDAENASSSPPLPTSAERRVDHRRFTHPERRIGGRIFLHPWQEQELVTILGVHAEAFSLDEWIATLTVTANQRGLTFPSKEDRWEWVLAELRAEIDRRGLPVATAKTASVPTPRVAGCKHQPPCADAAEHTRRDLADRRKVS